MNASDRRSASDATSAANVTHESGLAELWETVRRAFAEFLAVPTAIILGFLVLAAGSYTLDQARPALLEPFRAFLNTHVFADAQATSELLGTVTGGIITLTRSRSQCYC